MPDQTGNARGEGEARSPADTSARLTKADSAGLSAGLAAGPQPRAQPPELPTEPKRRNWWLWAAILVLLAVIGAALYLQPWVASKTAVAVETIVPGPLTRVLAVNGTVAALKSVAVRSSVSGKLVTLNVEAGDKVAAGDVLAAIDNAQQQTVLRTAQAALEAGTLAQAQASATRDRTVALGPNVTRNTVEDAERTLQSAKEEVGRLTALVDHAKLQLANYVITAPIAGTVLSRGVDLGQLVDASSGLFTLADLSQLVVETNVDETYATQIAVGQPAVLQLVGETQTRPGNVTFVAPQVDVATGGLAVKIAFDTPQNVPVGLTVTANVIVDQQAAAISAPRAAIVSDVASASVFLVKDGLARRQTVSVVDWPAERLLVTAGLAAGDILILDASGLTDGQAVTVKGN